MKISSSLLKPNINLLQHEFWKLKTQADFERNDEALRLRLFIDKQLLELEQLSREVAVLETVPTPQIPEKVYFTYKKTKQNLRISTRTWSRIISNEARVRKMQEKRNVATFAA